MTTPLQQIIMKRIDEKGPMTICDYIALCLGHPEHGYYMTRDPFGTHGDFVTAPEISQMFGELVGLWLIHTWHLLGEPSKFNLVELGPGRGTLMSDILRVAKTLPAFAEAAKIHFVETSPTLRKAQMSICPNANWHDDLSQIPARTTLFIANEFFDALPIRQYAFQNGSWYERVVVVKDGRLALDLSAQPTMLTHTQQEGKDGDIYEHSDAGKDVANTLCKHMRKHSGAGLIIDYGYLKDAYGDTLQAVKNHTYCSLLETPGECDLTTHVNFAALYRIAKDHGLNVAGPTTQGNFLKTMGIVERGQQLSENATAEQKADIDAALIRLTDKKEMGDLFKIVAFATPTPHPLTGFSQ